MSARIDGEIAACEAEEDRPDDVWVPKKTMGDVASVARLSTVASRRTMRHDIEITELVAAIVGQHDGQVFISDATLRTIRPMVLEVARDDERGGYVISLRPEHNDGCEDLHTFEPPCSKSHFAPEHNDGGGSSE